MLRHARKGLLPRQRRGNFRREGAAALLGGLVGDFAQPLPTLFTVLRVRADDAALHFDGNHGGRAQLGELLDDELQLVGLGQALIEGQANRRLVGGQALGQADDAFAAVRGNHHGPEPAARAVQRVDLVALAQAEHLQRVLGLLLRKRDFVARRAGARQIERGHQRFLAAKAAHSPFTGSSSSS